VDMMKKEEYICDFCGTSQNDVKYMLRSHKDACICDSCVEIAVEIIKENEEKKMTIVNQEVEVLCNETNAKTERFC
jgi:ATP-dependent protease Clp ATPase subunit